MTEQSWGDLAEGSFKRKIIDDLEDKSLNELQVSGTTKYYDFLREAVNTLWDHWFDDEGNLR